MADLGNRADDRTLYDGHPLAGQPTTPDIPDAPSVPAPGGASPSTPGRQEGTGAGVPSGSVTPDAKPDAVSDPVALALRDLVADAFEQGWRMALQVAWQQHGARTPNALADDWVRWMPDIDTSRVTSTVASTGTNQTNQTNLAAGTRPLTATGAGQAG